MIGGYGSIMHHSGVYGAATIQYTASNIHTKDNGFDINHKWTELALTEVFELGWEYTFINGIKLNPHGQLLLEELPKHSINMLYGNDTETFSRTMIATTILGLICYRRI